MKLLLKLASVLGLLLTIGPAICVFTGSISAGTQKTVMAYGMILWFATAPLWIKEQEL